MSRHSALFIFYNNKFMEAVMYGKDGSLDIASLQKFPIGSIAIKVENNGRYYYWRKESQPEDLDVFNRGWVCKDVNCTADEIPLSGEALSYLLIL